METKSILFGIALSVLTLALMGASYAAIATAGQTVTVPQGKVAMYFVMDTNQATELRDALCHNNNHNQERDGNCADFAQQKIVTYLKDNVKAYRKYQHEQNYDGGTDPDIE